MATRISTTSTSSSTQSQSHSESKNQSQSQSESTSQKVLDEALLGTILAGLTGQMTEEELAAYAQNLLAPQKNAEIEASRQKYETAKLSREQEIENLAAALTKSIEEQKSAYTQNMADVQTAALARGMGRSSYTMQALANQGELLAKAVRELTQENERQSDQIQKQITQAAEQDAQTQGRINTDYAANLAAKVQELREAQRKEQNSNYLTAVSASMGQKTTGSQSTTGSSTTDTTGSSQTQSTSTTVSSSGGSSRSKKAAEEEEEKPAASKTIYGRYSPENTSKIR